MLLWPGTDTCFSLCAPLVPFEIVISLCARLEEDKLSETKTPCLASACPGAAPGGPQATLGNRLAQSPG
jgi:hypothetical protein